MVEESLLTSKIVCGAVKQGPYIERAQGSEMPNRQAEPASERPAAHLSRQMSEPPILLCLDILLASKFSKCLQ